MPEPWNASPSTRSKVFAICSAHVNHIRAMRDTGSPHAGGRNGVADGVVFEIRVVVDDVHTWLTVHTWSWRTCSRQHHAVRVLRDYAERQNCPPCCQRVSWIFQRFRATFGKNSGRSGGWGFAFETGVEITTPLLPSSGRSRTRLPAFAASLVGYILTKRARTPKLFRSREARRQAQSRLQHLQT